VKHWTLLALPLLIGGLVGCSRNRHQPEAQPEPAESPESPAGAEAGSTPALAPAATPESTPLALPAGFRRVGRPEEHAAYLPPEAAWREAVSRLSELRAEARADGEDLLVTLERDSLSVTARTGRWRLWRFPTGLVLEGAPVHVLLKADLELEAYAADGTQMTGEKEVVIVTAKARRGEGGTREFRLTIKAGATFGSISTPG